MAIALNLDLGHGLWLGLAAVATLSVRVPDASAHWSPGTRAVVVQAEAEGLAVLITYKPADGTPTELLVAEAARIAGRDRRGQPDRARLLETLEGLLAARALALVSVTAGGKPVPFTTEARLGDIPEGSGRPIVAVLVSARLPAGAGAVTVDVRDDGTPTHTRWNDKSSGLVTGSAPPGVVLVGRTSLILRWSKSR